MSNDIALTATSEVLRSSKNQSSTIARQHSPEKANDVTQQSVPAVSQVKTVSGNNVPTSEVRKAEQGVEKDIDEKQLTEAVSKLNEHAQMLRRELSFSIDEELNRTIITVYDAETDEKIRQIPAEEVLTLARNFADGNGSLLKEKA